VPEHAVYNGMPAAELGDVGWRLVRVVLPGAAGGENVSPEGAGVELARLADGQVAVRNAADPDGPALIYTRAEIEAFIGGAQDGDFDDLIA
jgi:hypothetical protein